MNRRPSHIQTSLIRALAGHEDAARVWIALSGGIDSTVLIHLAASCRDSIRGTLSAIHLDHGIHPDSAGWGEHCRTLCNGLDVPLMLRRIRVQPAPGESLEAVAREARYRAISEQLGPGDLVLTAHNQDDQAETLLLALLRGSGVHGLAAMPVGAPLGMGHLLRPLLGHTRSEIDAYARAHGLHWIEDPSNSSLAMDRNYLRHRILPLLRERWPAVSETLARSAGHCAEAAKLIDGWCAENLPRLAGTVPDTLDIGALLGLEPPRLRATLRLWIRRMGLPPPDRIHLARIIGEVLPARADADPMVAWRGCEIRRYRRDLFALAPLPPRPGGELVWSEGTLVLPHGLGTLQIIGPDGTRGSSRPLSVRFATPGTRCRPPGGAHHRPLKALYQEQGIPPWLRPYCPMIFADTRLIAIAGLCACTQLEPYTPTGQVLRWTNRPWESMGLLRIKLAL